VLGQPAAIKAVADFARSVDAVKYFDAGDVQANGFQIVEDDRSDQTFTEAGASYMGFAVSALLASAFADAPRYGVAFSGDGSFTMNPQVLIDAVEHGARGMVAIFDNRRMAAISALQRTQYGAEFKACDGVAVDYVRLCSSIGGVTAAFGGYDLASLKRALEDAYRPDGISVVHVPVYAGEDELAGLGAWGQWNVGNWCADVQREWLAQEL
jgi:3D-(3,5/4)-trihydroxycyclohexane-1,2-dione acylhydrolase (decyclizing)